MCATAHIINSVAYTYKLVYVHKSSVNLSGITGITSRNYHFPVVDQVYLVREMGNELFGVFSVPHYRSHWCNLIYELPGNFFERSDFKVLNPRRFWSAAKFPTSSARWWFALRQHMAWQCSLDSSTASVVGTEKAKEELVHVLVHPDASRDASYNMALCSIGQDHEPLSPLVSSTECSDC